MALLLATDRHRQAAADQLVALANDLKAAALADRMARTFGSHGDALLATIDEALAVIVSDLRLLGPGYDNYEAVCHRLQALADH